ncbi:MAG: hypothetical protein ACUVTD_03000 [Nitrososphaerales archaeon]
MKVYLCGSCEACPVVEVKGEEVTIGEGTNIVRLKKEEWNILVAKVRSGELSTL